MIRTTIAGIKKSKRDREDEEAREERKSWSGGRDGGGRGRDARNRMKRYEPDPSRRGREERKDSHVQEDRRERGQTKKMQILKN